MRPIERILSILVGGVLLAGCASTPEGMVSLRQIRRLHELEKVKRTETRIEFDANGRTLTFHADSRRTLFDDTLIWLNAPAWRRGRSWAVAQADYENVLAPLLGPEAVMRGTDANRVLLDPGHGGNDHGASDATKTLREKDLVYDIATRLDQVLRRQGMLSVLTRERTQSVGLSTRSLSARRWKSDLFISIHCNSAANKQATGIETFVLPAPGFPSTSGNRFSMKAQPGNRHDPSSMLLAYLVHRQVVKRSGAFDRGIKHARWQVLKEAPCPAILIECGFLSSREETARLAKADYRQKLAEAIAEGVLAYSRISRDANPILVPGGTRR